MESKEEKNLQSLLDLQKTKEGLDEEFEELKKGVLSGVLVKDRLMIEAKIQRPVFKRRYEAWEKEVVILYNEVFDTTLTWEQCIKYTEGNTHVWTSEYWKALKKRLLDKTQE